MRRNVLIPWIIAAVLAMVVATTAYGQFRVPVKEFCFNSFENTVEANVSGPNVFGTIFAFGQGAMPQIGDHVVLVEDGPELRVTKRLFVLHSDCSISITVE